MKKRYTFRVSGMAFLLLILFSFSAFSQTSTVQGTVKDNSGKALPGVSIKMKGSTNTAITDAVGKFSIQVSGKAKLQFSCEGYIAKIVNTKKKTTIDVVLVKQAEDPDQSVNIGYDSRKRTKITNSVSTIDQKTVEESSVTDITQLFEHVAGVEVIRSGSTIKLRIRGVHSLNGNNEPLIIVNGSPFNGTIDELNKDDIKSIDILKDDGATAIYGMQGANGVIIITTNSGQ
jgi:TonB-dependent SusC/RagA subfamily outer membrane receptor